MSVCLFIYVCVCVYVWVCVYMSVCVCVFDINRVVGTLDSKTTIN